MCNNHVAAMLTVKFNIATQFQQHLLLIITLVHESHNCMSSGMWRSATTCWWQFRLLH